MVPDVSVVVATARAGLWLDLAVESVLQEVNVNFEIIVVFDGIVPEDRSDWVQDDRVTCLHNKQRRGVAASARRGIESSASEYIARLDSDDVNEAGRLQAQLQYLGRHTSVQAVGGRAWRINELGDVTGHLGTAGSDDLRRPLTSRNVLVQSSIMFRRHSYDRVGGYNANMLQMEDYDLWLRLGLLGPLASMDQHLIRYRVHGNQLTRGVKPFTAYARRIMLRQYTLGRHMGLGRLSSSSAPTFWQGAQVLRYLRLRGFGYDRTTSHSPLVK